MDDPVCLYFWALTEFELTQAPFEWTLLRVKMSGHELAGQLKCILPYKTTYSKKPPLRHVCVPPWPVAISGCQAGGSDEEHATGPAMVAKTNPISTDLRPFVWL